MAGQQLAINVISQKIRLYENAMHPGMTEGESERRASQYNELMQHLSLTQVELEEYGGIDESTDLGRTKIGQLIAYLDTIKRAREATVRSLFLDEY